jgi:prolyl oligopeptidase
MPDLKLPAPPLPPAPVPPRADLVETLHGIAVADPFRTLEDDRAAEVVAWVDAQQARTAAVLAAIPERARVRAQFESLWEYPREGVPQRYGRLTFFTRYDGRQAQYTWWVRDGEGAERVLIDPNGWSDDGTISLGAFSPSPDGACVGYTRRVAGSDWTTLHVLDVATGTDLPDIIPRLRWASPAWAPDGSGFLYARPGPDDDVNTERLAWHNLGDDPALDRVVFVSPLPSPTFVWAWLLDDDSGFIVGASRGTDPDAACWLASPPGPDVVFRKLWDAGFTSTHVVRREGERLIALSELDAPRGRMVSIDLADPSPASWRTIIPHSGANLEGAVFVGGRWLVWRSEHGWFRVESRAPDGSDPRPIVFPDGGLAAGLGCGRTRPEHTEIYFGVTTIARPNSVFRYDIESGALETVIPTAARADLADAVASQVFVTARDGASVPLTIIHAADFPRDGSRPVRMYAYGGYAIPSTQGFSWTMHAWVRAGGAYAIAHIRGGGEEGRAWHEAARRERKQNSFNDMIDCGEWLVAQGYASPRTLGIEGGSNGGLLVAACMVQRPDLFGGVLCNVPTVDMLRFHLFTVGAGWIPEYGDPRDAEDFRVLLAYSPVHNVDPATIYPPVMISTADHDDRVVPGHAFKFAALLQQTPSPVVLLRVESSAGHGMGASTAQSIARAADHHAFLWTALSGGFRA